MTTADFEQLMEKRWSASLDAYGTPKNFIDGTMAIIINNLDNPEDVPFTWVFAPGYAARRELMVKQKEKAEERKATGETSRWTNDGANCFLCDNIGQARDLGNNLILPFDNFKDYVLLPNKYPAFLGDMLLCIKEHNKDGQERQDFPADYIPTGIYIAEKYGLNFLRNHPRAGMSIPGHDHFQIKPRKISSASGKDNPFSRIVECELNLTEYGEGIFKVNRTRFDTLALKGEESLENAVKLINNLRKNDKIFTFYYVCDEDKHDNGTFYVSVNEKEDEKKRIGAGSALYLDIKDTKEHPSYEDCLKIPREFLYRRETFSWGNYF